MITAVESWALFALVLFQTLVYAGSWFHFQPKLADERKALLNWTAFMVLTSAALILSLLRDDGRMWLAVVGTNLISLLAFIAMKRGFEHFILRRPNDAEHFWVAGIASTLIVYAGPSPDMDFLRKSTSYASAIWLTARSMQVMYLPLTREFGIRIALTAVVPGALLVLYFVILMIFFGGFQREIPRFGGGLIVPLLLSYMLISGLMNYTVSHLLARRLLAQLDSKARRDHLTGLFNRMAFEEITLHEWNRHQRTSSHFAYLALDIDHFKSVNDTYGHDSGDIVLAETAARIAGAVRRVDVAARVGGEEFSVFLPDTNLDEAMVVAERIRLAIHSEPIMLGDIPLSITISGGIALVNTEDASVSNTAARADKALYDAKHQGRNRICHLAG
jgi:diguanylate cyclase (GGDEF)-like protein